MTLGVGLTEKEEHDFFMWGFGYIPDYGPCIEDMNAWNSRHGDKLMLQPDSDPRDDLPKMIKLWRENDIK